MYKNRNKKDRREIERLLGNYEEVADQTRLLKAITMFLSDQKENIRKKAASYEKGQSVVARKAIYDTFDRASRVLQGVMEDAPTLADEIKALIELLETERRSWLRICVEPYFSSLTRTGRVLDALRSGTHRPSRGMTARCDN